jgi:hypothetical protein
VEYTWKLEAGTGHEVRQRLESKGFKPEDREIGFFVKDASGIGIAVTPV